MPKFKCVDASGWGFDDEGIERPMCKFIQLGKIYEGQQVNEYQVVINNGLYDVERFEKLGE